MLCECLIKETQWLPDVGWEVRFPQWRILEDWDWSSGVWVLQTAKQATRVGTPEIIIGRREEPVRDTSPRGLARTGLFSVGHRGDE